MPNFYYKAVTRDGETDEGQMIGDSAAAIIARLQESGRIPILAEEVVTKSSARARPGRRRKLRKKSGRADVTAFTQSLAALARSSVPLDRALQIMLEAENNPATLKLVTEVQASVRGGMALSAALEEQSGAFSTFHTSMIRAAEASGTLSEGLERLAEYLQRAQELRDKVLSALIYPAILAGVAGLSVIILLVYVIPQFRPIFDEMGSALPLATRMTLTVSDFVASFGWIIVAAIIAVAAAMRQLWQRPDFRRRVDGLMLRMQAVGPLVQAVDTARFSRSLGTLLSNGVPLLSSLPIARDTMGNRIMAGTVSEAANDLREGGDLSATLQSAGVFPSLAIQLLKVGEESGTVDETMMRLADTYDREVETKIQRLLALLEPVLIIGLGIVIAGIIMSVLIGIISINELPA
jgi:general secretion pathway protein F